MIITPLPAITEKDTLCLSAEVICDHKQDVPDTLWFRFPRSYESVISKHANGFLVTLLPLAMHLGEDIHIAGTVSSQLAYSLKEYQRTLHFWRPEWFSVVSITADTYDDRPAEDDSGTTCLAFSGGIDSFYTLWEHLPEREPHAEYQVTHALFIHGFDIGIEDTHTYDTAYASYEELLDSLRITLIGASTNARRFLRGINMDWRDHAIVVGVALFLEGFTRRFYFSDEDTLDGEPPFAATQRIFIPFFSTERMEFIPYGGTTSKLDKAIALAKWPETHHRLRVCWEHPHGLTNCCRCYKCMMSMSLLDMAGSLHKHTTFPLPVDRKVLRTLRCRDAYFIADRRIFRKRLWGALKTGRRDIAFDYRYILFMSWCATRTRQLWHGLTHPLASLFRLSAVVKHHVPPYYRLCAALTGRKKDI